MSKPTWPHGLQGPLPEWILALGAAWSGWARTSFHIGFLVVRPRCPGAVVKETMRSHDLCEAPFTSAHTTLRTREQEKERESEREKQRQRVRDKIKEEEAEKSRKAGIRASPERTIRQQKLCLTQVPLQSQLTELGDGGDSEL